MSEFDVVLEHVSKTYRGGARAVIDFSAELRHGEFVAMLGPSGCGKTTTLRMIGGLEEATEGKIFIAGKDVTDLPPALRDTSMMFQSFALFPHRTVFQNVEFSLKMKGMEKSARDRRVWEMLGMVGLSGFATRRPSDLSGGQQQRVALARALAVGPELLLMDEPLSNLDARLREEVRVKIKALVRELGVTVLYVTHDQVEAMTLADRIAVMADGHILQAGAPDDLYRRPMSPRVAEFFGAINWIAGHAVQGGRIETEIGVLELNSHQTPGGGRIILGIRPEDLKLSPAPAHSMNELVGKVRSAVFTGGELLYEIEVNGKLLLARTMSDSEALKGSVFVYFPAARLAFFPEGAI